MTSAIKASSYVFLKGCYYDLLRKIFHSINYPFISNLPYCILFKCICSSKRTSRSEDLTPDDYFPQEIGVVAIRGTDEAVSLSKVLMGLFVGMKPNRKTDITSYESVADLNIPPEQMPQDKIVDALFSVTLAGKKTFFFCHIYEQDKLILNVFTSMVILLYSKRNQDSEFIISNIFMMYQYFFQSADLLFFFFFFSKCL